MKTKSARKKRSSDLTPGVVVLHNIPHGFYEDEMKKFFTQFGTVLRLRLSRSRKVFQFIISSFLLNKFSLYLDWKESWICIH